MRARGRSICGGWHTRTRTCTHTSAKSPRDIALVEPCRPKFSLARQEPSEVDHEQSQWGCACFVQFILGRIDDGADPRSGSSNTNPNRGRWESRGGDDRRAFCDGGSFARTSELGGSWRSCFVPG